MIFYQSLLLSTTILNDILQYGTFDTSDFSISVLLAIYVDLVSES